MIYPATLKTGDTIALLTPSGAVDPLHVEATQQRLQSWGYKTRIMPHALGVHGRYCGTPEERLSDLHQALSDREVSAILCTRGGYGLAQIIDRINPHLIQKNPKWIIGFSDITALHALVNRCGVASIHGPMARHLAEEPLDNPSSNHLRMLLSEGEISYPITSHPLNRDASFTGTLIGGNLAILQSLRGTPYDPINFTPSPILFIEDIGERPYQVERMIHNLRLGGAFDKLSGLIVGQFSDYTEDPSMGATLYELIRRATEAYSFPILFNFPVGHVSENHPLICGGQVTYRSEEELLTLTSK